MNIQPRQTSQKIELLNANVSQLLRHNQELERQLVSLTREKIQILEENERLRIAANQHSQRTVIVLHSRILHEDLSNVIVQMITQLMPLLIKMNVSGASFNLFKLYQAMFMDYSHIRTTIYTMDLLDAWKRILIVPRILQKSFAMLNGLQDFYAEDDWVTFCIQQNSDRISLTKKLLTSNLPRTVQILTPFLVDMLSKGFDYQYPTEKNTLIGKKTLSTIVDVFAHSISRLFWKCKAHDFTLLFSNLTNELIPIDPALHEWEETVGPTIAKSEQLGVFATQRPGLTHHGTILFKEEVVTCFSIFFETFETSLQ